MTSARPLQYSPVRSSATTTSQSPLLKIAGATWNPEQPTELRSLLRHGSSPHETDTQGNTCLHLLLATVNPNQHWTIHSLSILLRAGADLQRRNDFGATATDIACSTSSTLGSFKRDLLLQALLDCDLDISDARLFMPTELTKVYNASRHAALFNHRGSHSEFEMRTELLEQLSTVADERGLNCGHRYFEPALTRVIERHGTLAATKRDLILNETLQYLQRLGEGKKVLVRMCQDRFHKEAYMEYAEGLNILQMGEDAGAAALLAVDWFGPVKPEEVFALYAYELIHRLEEVNLPSGQQENVEALINFVLAVISTIQELPAPHEPGSDSTEHVDRVDSAKSLPPLKTDLVGGAADKDGKDMEEGNPPTAKLQRRLSIAQTPVEFYRPTSS